MLPATCWQTHFEVPEKEKNEVLDAFMAHKEEVISGTIK